MDRRRHIHKRERRISLLIIPDICCDIPHAIGLDHEPRFDHALSKREVAKIIGVKKGLGDDCALGIVHRVGVNDFRALALGELEQSLFFCIVRKKR